MQAQAPSAERRTARVKEAMLEIGVGRTSIYNLINSGQLKTVKVGRARLVLRSSLDALLQPEAA